MYKEAYKRGWTRNNQIGGNEGMRYYKSLYSSKICDKNLHHETYFLQDKIISKLTETDKLLCDNFLSIDECAKALYKTAGK